MITLESIRNDLDKAISSNNLTLPSPPLSYSKVHEVATDDAKSIEDLLEVIQFDVVLVTRILQIANSPLLRGSSEITSLKSAVTRLGINFIKNLSICSAVKDSFKDPNPDLRTILNLTWIHSVDVAIYLSILVENFKHLKKDSALLIGLVHDIGVLPVVHYLSTHKDFSELAIAQVKSIVKHFTPYVGMQISLKWDFPFELTEAMRQHSSSTFSYDTNVSYTELLRLVHHYLSSNLNKQIEDKPSSTGSLDDLTYLETKTGISLNNISTILEEHSEEIASLRRTLALN